MIIKMTMENIKDINKANEPFIVIGRIVPKYEDNSWSFTEQFYDKEYEKSFPDEELDYHSYIDNPQKSVFFYYDDKNQCTGQVVLRKNWNRYAYIEDISVCQSKRGQGVGKALINQAIEWAKENNLGGIMLEAQDVNLIACRFYHKCGFKIGAVDNMLYANFPSADEKAIFWYLKF